MSENDMVIELPDRQRAAVLEGWLQEVTGSAAGTRGGSDKATENEAQDLLRALENSLGAGGAANFDQPLGEELRELLAKVSRAGASRGDSTSETSRFVMSVKRPLFSALKRTSSDSARLTAAIWAI